MTVRKKLTTGKTGKPKTAIEMLLSASFGKGDPGAQLLAVFAADCFAPLPRAEGRNSAMLRMARRDMIKTMILEVIWSAVGEKNGELFRDLGNALDEQRRDP